MKIDAVKFKKALEESGKTRAQIAVAAGYSTSTRITQLEKDGGEVNANIVAAMAKEMKVKPGDISEGE